MAFLDKFKFWKKEEDKFAELDKQLGTTQTTPSIPEGTDDFPHHPFGGEPIGQPVDEPSMQSAETGLDFGTAKQESGFEPFTAEHPAEKRNQYRQVYEVQQQVPQTQNVQQQLELVAAKLDTIRVSLESINHRLVAVERSLHVQEYEETPVPRRRRGVW